tara:strand:- start:869 stop:2359 length:1491 start_codon:yes stop_codon:yes gene_type:complete
MSAERRLEKIENRMFSIAQSGKEFQEEMGGLAKVVDKLNDSNGLGKTWGIISRMSSGIFPNFWSVQNKVRAVTVIFDKHYKTQREQVAKQIESITALEKLQKIPEGLDIDHDSLRGGALNQHFNKMKGQIEEFASVEKIYKSALKQDKLTDDVKKLILTNMKDEVKPTAKAKKQIEKRLERGIKTQLEIQKINKKFKNSPVRRFFAKQKLALKTFVQGGAKVFGKILLYFTAIVLGLFMLKTAFDSLKPVLTKVFEDLGGFFSFMIDMFVYSFGLISLGISELVEGFRNGNFLQVLWGLFNILSGVLGLVVATLVTVIGGVLVFIGSLIVRLTESLLKGGEEALNTLAGILLVIGTVVLYLVLIGSALATWPVILAAAIGVAVAAAIKKIGTDKITGAYNSAKDKVGQYLHTGGVVNSNMQLVGERGAELVSLPRGSRVHSNADSKRMGGSGGNTIHVHVNGRVGASDAEIRDIANKVAREINLRMSRTGSGVNNF